MNKNRFPYIDVPSHQRYSIRELNETDRDGLRVYFLAERASSDKNAYDLLNSGEYPAMESDAAVLWVTADEAQAAASSAYLVRGAFLWEVIKAAGDMPLYLKVQ